MMRTRFVRTWRASRSRRRTSSKSLSASSRPIAAGSPRTVSESRAMLNEDRVGVASKLEEAQPVEPEQSFDEFIAERRTEHDLHLSVHVQAIDRARNASAIYLESVVIAKQAAGDAQRIERELAVLGYEMPKTAYAVQPESDMDPDVIAIQKMYEALRDLDRSERARVVSVVIDKYSIS
jgi:hypothetical protein